MVELYSNDKELMFFINLMKHFSLNTSICTKDHVISMFGMSQRLGDYFKNHLLTEFGPMLAKAQKRTVYYYTNPLNCCYVFFDIDETDQNTFLIIGPYTTLPNQMEHLVEVMEENHFSSDMRPILELYYQEVTHFPDDSFLLASVNAFAEQIYHGSNRFNVEKINSSHNPEPSIAPELLLDPSAEFSQALTASILEKRYEIENNVLSIVSQGQVHKLDQHLATHTDYMPVETRVSDALRNQKNYLIIFNTLLRKAAEQGGVHPLYINEVSRDFFIKIESLHSLTESVNLQKNMMRKYCLLVHNKSTRNYSQLVQKAIILIDSDLTADLSLSAMSKALNINASYLSSHFHRETGQTLTAYVNNKRIDYAIMMLNTTNLQVQSIAQYCGISDINYFTRIFKKLVGMTPTQYRDSIL